MVSHGIAGRSGPEISSTSAPWAASVRPATGPAITRDRSSTRMPASGRSPLGHGFGAASPIFVDRDQRQSGERLGMRRRRPFVMRAHQGDDAAAGIGRGLERLAVPLHQRGLNRRRAPACSSAPCRRRRGDAGNWCAAARSAHRGSCRRRRSRPRPAAAACRRRADNVRSGIRPRHGACRPRRPAPAPLRIFQISAAASPVAATLACAAAATRNDDGSCGSSPVSVSASSAEASPPAEVQISERISRGLCIGVSLP